MRGSKRLWAVVVAAAVAVTAVAVSRDNEREPAVQVAADRGKPSPAPDVDEPAPESAGPASTTSSTVPSPTTTLAGRVSPPTSTSTTAGISGPTPTTTAPHGLLAPAIAREPYPHARGSGTDGHLPPGGSVYPFDARRTAWEASHEGYSLRVQADSAMPKAGEPVRMYSEFSGPAGSNCCIVLLGWAEQRYQNPDGTCPPQRSYEGWSVFNHPGRTVFEAIVYECGLPSPRPVVWLLGELEVGDGQGTRQGPVLPQSTVLDGGSTGNLVSIRNVDLEDVDGWIVGFDIDWGDGNPVESYPGQPPDPDLYPGIDEGCVPQAPHGWPSSAFHTRNSEGGPYGTVRWNGPQQFDHLYPDSGPYTVTITARSTACDGLSVPQEGSTTFTWTPDWRVPV
jgi:hypothetical protein